MEVRQLRGEAPGDPKLRYCGAARSDRRREDCGRREGRSSLCEKKSTAVVRSETHQCLRRKMSYQSEQEQYQLRLACFKGREWFVRSLPPGCDVNASDENGWTPLMIACFEGHEGCVRALLHRSHYKPQMSSMSLGTVHVSEHPHSFLLRQ